MTSAVLLAGRGCLPVLLLVGVVMGIGELTMGRGAVVAVFWYGHVVASLLVFAALAAGTSLHELCQKLVGAADVGPSYGVVAVLGGLGMLVIGLGAAGIGFLIGSLFGTTA